MFIFYYQKILSANLIYHTVDQNHNQETIPIIKSQIPYKKPLLFFQSPYSSSTHIPLSEIATIVFINNQIITKFNMTKNIQER